jgi:hypothetical protein
MKEWEVSKVNALYKDNDDLKKRIAELEKNAAFSALDEKLSVIENKIDLLCKCCDCSPPAKSKK